MRRGTVCWEEALVSQGVQHQRTAVLYVYDGHSGKGDLLGGYPYIHILDDLLCNFVAVDVFSVTIGCCGLTICMCTATALRMLQQWLKKCIAGSLALQYYHFAAIAAVVQDRRAGIERGRGRRSVVC
jgi:hypothetical protein